MAYLEIAFRCMLGGIFLISSVSKVVGRGAFDALVDSLHGLRLLPAPLCRPAALAAVVTESAAWMLLAVPGERTGLAGFTLAAGLLTVFATSIAFAVRRGARMPCRCFGASGAPLGPRHALRNALLLVLAALGASAASASGGHVDTGGAAVAALSGLLLGVLVTVLDDIIELFRTPVAET